MSIEVDKISLDFEYDEFIEEEEVAAILKLNLCKYGSILAPLESKEFSLVIDLLECDLVDGLRRLADEIENFSKPTVYRDNTFSTLSIVDCSCDGTNSNCYKCNGTGKLPIYKTQKGTG